MVGATAEETASARARALARRPAAIYTGLAAGLVAVGALLYHLTRGTTLWFDDWDFVLNRRGSSLATFLAPHGEHFSLFPVLLYKLLFATAGVGDYQPYRVMVILGHLMIVALLFLYARGRVGDLLAVLAAGLIGLFGPGWEDILWPFQVAWQLSLIGGLGMLLALDFETRWGDIAACGLLVLSLASSGVGLPVALGALAEVVLLRRRERWWVVGLPLFLYVIWWIGYQNAPLHGDNVYLTPGFAASGIASTFSALLGLGGSTVPSGQGTLLQWGAPLALAGLAAGAWRVARLRVPSPRLVAVAVMLVAFWVIDGLGRANESPAYASRYLYVGAVLTLVVAVELARGVKPLGWPVRLLLSAAVGAAVISNVGALRSAAAFLRSEGQITRADLAAVDVEQRLELPGYVLHYLPGYPLVAVPRGSYLTVARSLGTPAFSLAQLSQAIEPAREVADLELIGMEHVALVRVPAPPPHIRCQKLVPAGVVSADSLPSGSILSAAPRGLVIGNSQAGVTVGVRHFGGQFQPLGSIAPGAFALLSPPEGGGSPVWQVQVEASDPALVCRL